jgi:hypothetical protein
MSFLFRIFRVVGWESNRGSACYIPNKILHLPYCISQIFFVCLHCKNERYDKVKHNTNPKR